MFLSHDKTEIETATDTLGSRSFCKRVNVAANIAETRHISLRAVISCLRTRNQKPCVKIAFVEVL